jgi:magnesium transporter
VAILCNALVAPLVFHETFRLRDFTGIVLSTAGAVTIVLSAKTQEEKVDSHMYEVDASFHLRISGKQS